MYSLRSISIVTIFAFSLLNCSNSTSNETDSEPAEGIVTLGNNGASSYTVQNIEGEGIRADEGAENGAIELEAGGRYSFNNMAGASNHPLDFRDASGEKLLGQSNRSGRFDSDEDVNVVREGNRITFTLTQLLAGEIAEYICSFHPDMNGSVTAAP